MAVRKRVFIPIVLLGLLALALVTLFLLRPVLLFVPPLPLELALSLIHI